MSTAPVSALRGWAVPAAVFGVVLVAQLALVAAAGTDVPFYDQWNIEGGFLYPRWIEGSLGLAEIVQAQNEHRIVWANLLNISLFAANGQWDPLVQLVAVAFVRSATAAAITAMALSEIAGRARLAVGAGVAVAFLPHLAWHCVLWGIEPLVLVWSVLTLALLGTGRASAARTAGGLVAGAGALFAMAPAELVPVALLGLVAVRAIEARNFGREAWRATWPALVLLAAAWALRVEVDGHAPLRAASVTQFGVALVSLLGWPHDGNFLTALLLNLPLLAGVALRLGRSRRAKAGEDFVLVTAGWSVAIALAAAWVRGGGPELAAGVPSRYVDFLVFLPLANVWYAVTLAREAAPARRPSALLVASAWAMFLFVGWLALSAQVWRGIIVPRSRDREAPVRLVRAFQETGDAAVFSGQPRLLVPHPNPEIVRGVLADPRLAARLPPPLQPARPMGPLSRATRALLGR